MLKPLTVWITTNWKTLKKMGVPDHLICFLRNLYAGQEATVRTRHRTSDWFKLGKEYKAVYCHSAYLTCMQSTCVLSRFNHVWLLAILWIIAHHASLSKRYSRQEYWSGLPCPPRGESFQPRDQTCFSCISCIGRWILYHECHLGNHIWLNPQFYTPRKIVVHITQLDSLSCTLETYKTL